VVVCHKHSLDDQHKTRHLILLTHEMAATAISTPLNATNFLLCVHKQTVVSGPKVVRSSPRDGP
jgi:hypothetical protein